MKLPTTIRSGISRLVNTENPAGLLIKAGCYSLLVYMFATFPAFLYPTSDWSHFPPYLALPEKQYGDPGLFPLIYAITGIAVLTIFLLYLLALKLSTSNHAEAPSPPTLRWWKTDRLTRVIIGFILIFHVAMFFMPTLLSTDIFDYIRHGRIFSIYGENPLTVPATYFSQDPFFGMGGWVSTGSVYGPLHVYLTGALTYFAGNSISLNLLLFKVFFLAINLVNIWLIWKITYIFNPGRERLAMVLYGWSPFVLVIVAENAHNDLLMLTFVLLGFLSHLKNRFLIAVLCFTLATLLKFITLPILVVYIALLIRNEKSLRDRLKIGAISTGLVSLATIICYLPFWEGMQTFYYTMTVGRLTNFTIPPMIRNLVADYAEVPMPQSHFLVQMVLAVILMLYLAWQLKKVHDTESLLAAAIGLAFITPVTLYWFQPWYITVALGLVAIKSTALMLRVMLFFSFTVLFYDNFWWQIPMSVNTERPLRTLIVIGLPLILLAVLKARELKPAAGDLMAWIMKDRNPKTMDLMTGSSEASRSMVVFATGALIAAAVIPMVLVISSSPQLSHIADLLLIKLRFLIDY